MLGALIFKLLLGIGAAQLPREFLGALEVISCAITSHLLIPPSPDSSKGEEQSLSHGLMLFLPQSPPLKFMVPRGFMREDPVSSSYLCMGRSTEMGQATPRRPHLPSSHLRTPSTSGPRPTKREICDRQEGHKKTPASVLPVTPRIRNSV